MQIIEQFYVNNEWYLLTCQRMSAAKTVNWNARVGGYFQCEHDYNAKYSGQDFGYILHKRSTREVNDRERKSPTTWRWERFNFEKGWILMCPVLPGPRSDLCISQFSYMFPLISWTHITGGSNWYDWSRSGKIVLTVSYIRRSSRVSLDECQIANDDQLDLELSLSRNGFGY